MADFNRAQLIREFQVATKDLQEEIAVFNVNVKQVVDYQESLLNVERIMCMWMENTQKLGEQRDQLHSTNKK